MQPENWHKNLSQLSDIPISKAVSPLPGSGIVLCINPSPKEEELLKTQSYTKKHTLQYLKKRSAERWGACIIWEKQAIHSEYQQWK